MRKHLKKEIIIMMIFLCGCTINYEKESQITDPDWQSKLNSALPSFGHRNWIIVADAAYPKQSAPGIETFATGKGQVEVIKYVLNEIDKAQHIYPIVSMDAELKFVHEEVSKGVNAYRNELQTLLQDKEVSNLPHEEIIAKLDEAGKMFNILILKTNMTIPYTSVFLELACGYWDSENEAKLRMEYNKILK
jgi:D-ribose pyranose/furanose isomerase RbsD